MLYSLQNGLWSYYWFQLQSQREIGDRISDPVGAASPRNASLAVEQTALAAPAPRSGVSVE